MPDDRTRGKVLPRWPVLVGLGLVTLLIAAMIGLDLHFSEEEASRTTDIIEDSQHSIVLLNGIRFEAKHLEQQKDLDEIQLSRRRIANLSRQYEPIATYPGERETWKHLQELLRQLPVQDASDSTALRMLDETIDQCVDTLITINTAAGRGNLAAIRASHSQAIWSDTAAGASVLVVVTIISVWLLRVLSRQRKLILREVQLLDEKNSELEAFAGRAAHDLRTPMNPIRGYADLILERPQLPEDVSGMVQRIRISVDRMARVVDDMLSLSVSGRPPEGQSASDVVVEHVLEEMKADLQGVDLATKLAGGRVRCAEETLSQILRNLLTNAVKFRASTRPLRIGIETREKGSAVELVIEDNGIGMDSETAGHVFEPFYRGPTERKISGHGLGLAIVERVTRALGGSCALTSSLDQGARVVVRLPRA